jgi:hypothetical protein
VLATNKTKLNNITNASISDMLSVFQNFFMFLTGICNMYKKAVAYQTDSCWVSPLYWRWLGAMNQTVLPHPGSAPVLEMSLRYCQLSGICTQNQHQCFVTVPGMNLSWRNSNSDWWFLWSLSVFSSVCDNNCFLSTMCSSCYTLHIFWC